MPAIWASSERSLSVRTIWVDGIRHAILTPDDPLIKSNIRTRPRTSKGKRQRAKSQQFESKLDHLNDRIVNSNTTIENNHSEDQTSLKIIRTKSAPICPRKKSSENYKDIVTMCENVKEFEKVAVEEYEDCREMIKECKDRVSNDNSIDNLIKEQDRLEVTNSSCDQQVKLLTRSNIVEVEQIEHCFDTHWNPLSERVLQWLDLSGKANEYTGDDELDISSGKSKEGSLVDDRFLEFINKNDRPKIFLKEQLVFETCKKGEKTKPRVTVIEKEQLTFKSYVLQKDNNSKIAEKPVDKGKAIKQLSERKKNANVVECLENNKKNISIQDSKEKLKNGNNMHVNEKETQNNVIVDNENQHKSQSTWSPPGRLQLHIYMPDMKYDERHVASSESLINES